MLQSVRLGFATNSSSSHSVIFAPKHPWTDSSLSKKNYNDRYILASKAHKMHLLAPTLEKSLHSAHQRAAVLAVLAQRGIAMPADMQSPYTFDQQGLNLAPPAGIDPTAWIGMLLDDSITIHAYPDYLDTTDTNHPFSLFSNACQVMGSSYYGYRWKQDADAIIGFNTETGMKFRWSPTPYTKSSVPELVDVKITDYCGFGCSFCYQGSTTQGQHAPLDRIVALFDTLADWGVFEVALGGGEPTDHPDLAAILRAGYDRGLAVSFTTYDNAFDTKCPDVLEAMRDAENLQGNDKGIYGAIGFSVHGPRNLRALGDLRERMWKTHKIFRPLCAQSVVGATPLSVIDQILDGCIDRQAWLLLLGYKTTGRGLGKDRLVEENALRALLKKAQKATEAGAWTGSGSDTFCLSVDTAFLDQYGHLLAKLNVPLSLRSSPEGKFSMYVDAVAQTCGPSSYAGDAYMYPVDSMQARYKDW